MNIKFFKQMGGKIRKSTLMLISVVICFTLLPQRSFAAALSLPASSTELVIQDNGFNKGYREGRDLIAQEEWAKAAKKFDEIISRYPNNNFVDAALYWLAFCYKKQKQFKAANAALDRLLKEFPASSWADDARVMRLEIRKSTDNIYLPVPTTTLDREDEIKLAAFQSLLTADLKRAIETVGDVLTPDSKTSENLKQQMVRSVRGPFLPRELGVNGYANSFGHQFLPLLRETLFEGFQKELNIKVRKEIIYTLSGINDEQSIKYITELYDSENDREIKRTIINSLSSPFHYLSKTNSKLSPGRKIALDKLMEIIRSEKDTQLRRLAFTNMQRFGGWTTNEQSVDLLSRLYDAERDEEFKISIIRILTKIKQNQATKKLLEIAKTEKSEKLRLEAIYALRNSNDPEVLKFLEELIK